MPWGRDHQHLGGAQVSTSPGSTTSTTVAGIGDGERSANSGRGKRGSGNAGKK